MEYDERLISSTMTESDQTETALRPKTLSDYVGQEQIKSNLNVYMTAAKKRGGGLSMPDCQPCLRP